MMPTRRAALATTIALTIVGTSFVLMVTGCDVLGGPKPPVPAGRMTSSDGGGADFEDGGVAPGPTITPEPGDIQL